MDAGFFELDLDQALGQRRAVDGHVKLRQDVRQRADVVFVAVGDDDAADLVLALLQVGDVRDDQVDPQHVLFGEHQAAVDDDDVVGVLDDHHVLADLA